MDVLLIAFPLVLAAEFSWKHKLWWLAIIAAAAFFLGSLAKIISLLLS